MNKVKEQIKFDFANNCFDVLRLYSAFYVMTLHIFRHIRLQEVSPVFDWWNGVVVLFCISGFLVPASMERSKNTWEFLKKRVLRISPSLWGSGGAEERRDGAAVRKGSDWAGQCPTPPR